MGGRNHNATDWTRMASTNASIDSFIVHSMEYIRTHRFDGIDLDWNFPAFCEGPDRCSPPSDALRFKIILERFRIAIESENVSPANKFIISSSAGSKWNQIYKTLDKATSKTWTTTSEPNTSVAFNQMTDLKIEIWSPIIGVIVIVLIVFLIVYCIKRKNAKITDDSETPNPDHDETDFEEYASYGSEDLNGTRRQASYYSQLYTAYDDIYVEYKQNVYAEYKEPYAEYKKPEK